MVEDPDLRRKAVLTRDEPGPSSFVGAASRVFDIDRLGLWIGNHGDLFHAFAEIWCDRSVIVHPVLVNLLLQRLSHFLEEVFIPVVVISPMRIPVLFELD